MRVLVAGLGAVGQRHARNLRALRGESLDLLALRSRRRRHVVTDALAVDASQDVEEALGARVFTDVESALAAQPDAVFVCTPSSMHVELALAAAQRGCHLFIEKPLADREEGVERLIDAVARRGLVATVGCQWRWHPVVKRLRELAASARLPELVGDLVAVHAEYAEWLPGWHAYEDYRGYFPARRDLGGGVILSQIHDVDYLLWMLGRPRRVMASGGRLGAHEIDVEDTSVMLMEFPWQGRPLPVVLHQDMLRRPPTRTCRVLGTEGQLEADLLEGVLRHRAASGAASEIVDARGYPRNQMFVDEVADFLSAVEARRAPAATLQEGADALRVALAARRSLEEGRALELEWTGVARHE